MTHGQGHKANDVFAPKGAWQSGVSADFFALDYDPFGSLLPGRNYSSDSYRFGFNGKENDNEVHGATGTFQDYGMRAYDTRVGRFFSVDPIAAFYPYFTPYQFSGNNPIKFIDLDGLEQDDPTVRLFYECAPQIDMTCAPELSPTNAAGYPRNGPWFWRKMLEAHPGQFSESNAAAIRQGRSPTVDAQWIKFNPTHAPYEGNTLIHHHVNQGKMAVGIPKQVHLDFFSKLHPNLRAGIKMSGKGIRGGLGVFASFADFAGVFTGNPDNMYYNMLVAPAVGEIHAIPSEGNQFIGSGQYYVPTSITKEYYESGALKSVSMSMDIYNGATWDDDAKKYVGVDKVGSSSVRYNYDESGNQTEFQQN
jgi:RHS repeat-associated protein